jgi:hypothetical protein
MNKLTISTGPLSLVKKAWATYLVRVVACTLFLALLLWASASFLSDRTISAALSRPQGLIDPRYGPSDYSPLQDNCDCARAISGAVTILSFVCILWLPVGKRMRPQRIMGEIVVLSAIPITTNLVLAYLLNHGISIIGGQF